MPVKDADRSRPLQLAVRAVDGAYNTQPEVGNQSEVVCSSAHPELNTAAACFPGRVLSF